MRRFIHCHENCAAFAADTDGGGISDAASDPVPFVSLYNKVADNQPRNMDACTGAAWDATRSSSC